MQTYEALESDVVSAVLDRSVGPEKSDRRVCNISTPKMDRNRWSCLEKNVDFTCYIPE